MYVYSHSVPHTQQWLKTHPSNDKWRHRELPLEKYRFIYSITSQHIIFILKKYLKKAVLVIWG